MSKKNKYILVTEDDKFLAEMIGKTLSNEVTRVVIVHNGQEALDALEKEVPDLLLLDLLMPVLDGYAVMSAIHEKNIPCTVVIISNISDKMTKVKCKEMGAKDYFVKSDMDDDNLWAAIRKYVA